jgi:DNA polymerase-3 subunit epsilon
MTEKRQPAGVFFVAIFRNPMPHPFPKNHEKQTVWAHRLRARRDWVVRDTETTGLDETAEAIQVAVLAPDDAELLNSLVRPVGEISPTLKTILSGKEVVVYNAAYDFRILWQSCLAAGISPTWLHGCGWRCAMERYAAWCGEWNDYYGSYRWQKLPAGDHSAADDYRATLDILRKMSQG